MDKVDSNETSLLIPRPGVPYDEPDDRQPYQKTLAVYLILASTTLERIAFYSLVANLVIALQRSELHWDPGNSITASFIFFGTSYISTLIFAVLSDAKLGRARTIIIGFVLYFLGYIIVILIVNKDINSMICPNSSESSNTTRTLIADEHCVGPVLGTLIFTAIGVGAVQANMAVFGAEQIHDSNIPSRYFDKYIVAVNIGGIFAILFVSYIEAMPNEPNRFFYGYLFAAMLIVGAALLFIIGYRFYIYIEPHDTIITKCIPVVINAFQTWRKHRTGKLAAVNVHRSSSSMNLFIDSTSISEDRKTDTIEKSTSFLDFARASHKGKFIDRIVDDVKSLRRVIIVFLLLMPYWLIYYQMHTTFILQGQHMSIPYISNATQTQMPVIWMSVGDQLSIIIGIVFLNLFIYPRLNILNQSTLIQNKFIIGMIVASLTMFIAGMVENFRQKKCQSNENLTIFTQLPQYAVMGISEVFAMVASFEFAYLAAPRSAQSLIMSLRFCSLGLSSFVSDAYVKLFTTTQEKFDFDCPNDKNEILYIYFYVLGGIQLVFVIIFILCQWKFEILRLNPYQINKRQFI